MTGSAFSRTSSPKACPFLRSSTQHRQVVARDAKHFLAFAGKRSLKRSTITLG